MIDRYVWLNGAVVERERAKVSALDHGMLFGDGIFETMRVRVGRVHLLRRHLERMSRSASRLSIPFDVELARRALAATVEANAAGDCVARLTLTGGLSYSGGEPTMLVVLRELPASSDPRGLRLVTLETPHTGFGMKSTSYLPYLLAMRERELLGHDEGILLTRDGFVAEGTVTNVFMVDHGALVTPPARGDIVPGVARGRVLELAREMEVEIREELFGIDELRDAQEVFVTNSVRGVLPARSIDEVDIPQVAVGSELRARYDAEMPDEGL